MAQPRETLHSIHIIIFIYLIQSGVVLFSLPRILAQGFGTNGWAALFIISGGGMVSILLIGAVYRMGEGESIFIILENSMPKVFIYVLYSSLIIIWSLLACIVGKQYLFIFQLIAGPTASEMVLKMAYAFLAYLIAVKSLYNIGKLAFLFFILTIWMLVLNVFLLDDVSLVHFPPFLFKDGGNWIKASFDVFTSLLGFELSILFFPYVNKRSRLIVSVLIGNAVTTVVYLITCIMCFGFFGYEYLKVLIFPFIDLLSNIELPFIERIENFLYALFLFKALMGSVMYYWAAKECAARVFKKTGEEKIVFFLIAATYFISFIPSTLDEISTWLGFLANAETVIAFALPALVIAVLFFRKRGMSHAKG
ncbi:GerAB/ArcD/ProY family transporter [Peribacillus sp. SCS-37]|uniref:GerAB/ArcD/ProY family transporter n=1 Tax=Paraperibacillus esterisolvens TaxID=3115296 RepID=UPI0039065453